MAVGFAGHSGRGAGGRWTDGGSSKLCRFDVSEISDSSDLSLKSDEVMSIGGLSAAVTLAGIVGTGFTVFTGDGTGNMSNILEKTKYKTELNEKKGQLTYW